MQSPTGNSQPGSMPVGARLRNAPVSVLPAHAREKIVAHSLARQYTSKVLARAVIRQARQAAIRQARQAAQGLLHEIYQDVVEDVVDKENLEKLERTSWQDKLEKLRQFARALPERRIRYVPSSFPGDQSLPAAMLADHRSHLLRMPILRLMSGKEIVVEIPRHCSTHDFYQLARTALNLGRSTSLALVRVGPGSFEDRLLPCVRSESSGLIRRRVFQVVTHA